MNKIVNWFKPKFSEKEEAKFVWNYGLLIYFDSPWPFSRLGASAEELYIKGQEPPNPYDYDLIGSFLDWYNKKKAKLLFLNIKMEMVIIRNIYWCVTA